MHASYVNLIDYPIDQPSNPLYQRLVQEQRRLLSEKGMINLKNFLTAEGIQKFQQEIEERMDTAYHVINERHPYGYHRSDEYPQDHPRNSFNPSEAHRMARHLLSDTKLDALYCWPPMRKFIADITGHESTYLSGDPSNGLVVQVYKEGGGQAWHFDQALFSTIINLSESDAGGLFECVPNIRTENDASYDEVKKVLDGQSEVVQSHKVKAGSFTIMLGRYTLHRVTKVEKQKPRISVVLSYELEPGIHMDLDTRLRSFGPGTPEMPLSING